MADAPAADPAPSNSPAPASPDPTVTSPVPDPAKPPETAKPAEPQKAPEPPKLTAPEKYDYSAIKLPEGVTLDTELLNTLEPKFKEVGLPQEAVAKLVEAHAQAIAQAEEKREADFKTWMAEQTKQHQAAVKKEWGLQYDANLAVAQRGIARFMSPEAKALLDETGLGNHPEFVKAFFQIGKMVSEDTPPSGQAPSGNGRTAAEVLYGSTSK